MAACYDRKRVFFFDAVCERAQGSLDRPLTNVAELCRSAEAASLLRLVGVKEERLSATASDYEFLTAITEALPTLAGHPLRERLIFLLSSALSLSLRESDAATLWHEGAALLAEENPTPAQLLERLLGAFPRLVERLDVPLSKGPFLLTAEAIHSAVKARRPVDWADWERNAEALLSDLGECRAVRITLPPSMIYRRSSRYDADRYVSGEARDREAEERWIAQSLWYLSSWAQRTGVTLLFFADGAGEEAVTLLRETERFVGLPHLVWIAEDAPTRDAMIAFASEPHARPVERALPICRYPTRRELEDAVESYAARTPLGRLYAVTDGAWWGMPYERDRLYGLLSRRIKES